MTRSLNFGNHLQVPHLLFFSQIPPLHLQRLLQLRISILFSTLPHHFCCLPPSPPSGQSLKQDWQSLQCFLLPYNSSVLVPILVALGPHWVPISLSGSLSIKISIHSLCSSICFLLSKDGICSRPRLMTILFHFLPSFFTLTIGKTVLETWHLRHWLQFWQLRTWIQTIILTWQLIATLGSIRNSCDVFKQYPAEYKICQRKRPPVTGNVFWFLIENKELRHSKTSSRATPNDDYENAAAGVCLPPHVPHYVMRGSS